MKRWIVTIILGAGLALIGLAEPAAFTRVKVLKNNCNLRAKALVTSEVVGQVSENDILAAKTMDKDWVEVVPPTNVDLWVLGDYIKDGAINCRQKVNVRAGAGINFNIVGQLTQGEKVDVRGTHAEWVKIAPLPACSLWISRSLVSVVPPTDMEPAKLDLAKAEPVKPVMLPAPAGASVPSPKPEAKPPISSPPSAGPHPPATLERSDYGQVVPAPVPVTVSAMPEIKSAPAQDTVFFPPPGLDLVPATGQGRWREVEGILRAKDFIFRAPSDYRLVNCDGGDKHSETICFVKGNQAQLEALMYRHLIVSGREYWVKRQKYPVLVPERIVIK